MNRPSNLSLRNAACIAVVAFGLYFFLVYVPTWPDETRSILSNCFNIGLGFLAAVFLYLASRSSTTSKRTKKAWLLLAGALLAFTIGNVIWTVIENILGQDPFPSSADFAYLIYYPLCIGGLLLLPTARKTSFEQLKQFLDLGIVAVASALLYWVLLISPIYAMSAEYDWQTLGVTMAYPALDLVVVWCVGLVLISQRQTLALGLFTLAAICLAMADGILNYQMLADTYQTGGDVSDLFYIGAYLFAFLAGVAHMAEQQKAKLLKTTQVIDAAPQTVAAGRASPMQAVSFALPYLWIGAAFCLLIREENRLLRQAESSFITEVTLGIGIIMGLVLIRQMLTLVETETLSIKLRQLLRTAHFMATYHQTHNLSKAIPSQLSGLIDCEQALLVLRTGQKDMKHVLLSEKYLIDESDIELTEDIKDGLVNYRDASDHFQRDQQLIDTIAQQASPAGAKPKAWLMWMTAPLIIQEQVVGFVAVGRRKPLSWQQSDVMVLFAHHASSILANAQLTEQESRTAAAQAATLERSRLARELHDSVSQALFGIVMGTQTARDLLPPELIRIKSALDFVGRLTEGALAEMRALIFELRPESLTQEGLIKALQRQTELLCRRHDMDAHILATVEPEVPMATKEVLYRIAIEAVQNSIKHSRAHRVDISLTDAAEQQMVVLEVKDDGQGFDPNQKFSGHLGLISMQERAEHIGGHFAIESAVGSGTVVRVAIPIYR